MDGLNLKTTTKNNVHEGKTNKEHDDKSFVKSNVSIHQMINKNTKQILKAAKLKQDSLTRKCDENCLCDKFNLWYRENCPINKLLSQVRKYKIITL